MDLQLVHPSQVRSISNNYNYKSIVVEWDYEHPCSCCGCLYLKTEKNRKICCNNGQFLTINSTFPRLNPLPFRHKLSSYVLKELHIFQEIAFHTTIF